MKPFLEFDEIIRRRLSTEVKLSLGQTNLCYRMAVKKHYKGKDGTSNA
jgi:hypothetical protein